MRQAADEAALLQRRDQPMDARLGLEVERVLHLVEGWRDAGVLDPLLDEHEQLVLLPGEHGPRLPTGRADRRREQKRYMVKCSTFGPAGGQAKPSVSGAMRRSRLRSRESRRRAAAPTPPRRPGAPGRAAVAPADNPPGRASTSSTRPGDRNASPDADRRGR